MSASALMADPEELIPTRDSLLSRLKDRNDQESWQDFFNTYWKLVYGVAIKAGLTDQEAQEVVQETVITVARRIPEFRYDPAVCSFKTWLLNLTRWRIVDQLRKRKPEFGSRRRKSETARTPTVERIPDPAGMDLDEVWNEEWEQYILDAAIDRVKKQVSPEQFQIFALRVFKEWPVMKIARELDVSVGQVYLAKHRVAALIKKQVRELEKKMT
ncbi:MAG: sigma-70 family RNA polymerase sigma factor [Verrucomicrobia subdivision 3 bacterium]|nr:sigma-70 family RNA polymerase sigma factor [Limisphaerales bacterium]